MKKNSQTPFCDICGVNLSKTWRPRDVLNYEYVYILPETSEANASRQEAAWWMVMDDEKGGEQAMSRAGFQKRQQVFPLR